MKPLRKFIFFIILMMQSGNSRTEVAAPRQDFFCIGPATAANAAIYFHGKQAASGAEDLEEMDVLRSISARANLRIAVVASRHRDASGKMHWPRNDLPQMVRDFSDAQAIAASCLGTKRHGILAFSSGGYFINRLFEAGILGGKVQSDGDEPEHHHTWILTIGAGGEVPVNDSPFVFFSNLVDAGSLTLHMLMGTDEGRYFDESAAYADHLQSRGRPVEFHSFRGGHFIPVEQTVSLIRQLLH